MIEQSESIKELSSALCKARANITGALKSSTNPHFKSKFADINSLIDASNEHLLAEGLVLSQHPITEFHASESPQSPPTVLAGVETILIHSETGQWLKSCLLMPCLVLDPQKILSCITYSRRGTMQAILNMMAVDDDGESIRPPTPVTTIEDKLPATSYNDIVAMINKTTDEKQLNTIYKDHIESSTTLNKDETLLLLKQCGTQKDKLKEKK
jgi:hypothetical protein